MNQKDTGQIFRSLRGQKERLVAILKMREE
jgi:hypothetical protein